MFQWWRAFTKDRLEISRVADLSRTLWRPRFLFRPKDRPINFQLVQLELMKVDEATKRDERYAEEERRALYRYTALTIALLVPLFLAFVSIRDLYPFAASRMMLWNGDGQGGRNYYVLRGETVSGETVDLPPINLTNALTGRSWSLVRAAVENQSFKIRSPHPANLRLMAAYDGPNKLPRAARLEELLRAWGEIYNSRLSGSSDQRLKSIRLDAYRWEGGLNGDYDRFVESWRAVL
jgi:hypothetical protein